jgi:hypothetical protein
MQGYSAALAYEITLNTLSGEVISLPPLQPGDTVYDLAALIRNNLKIPILVQKLVCGTAALDDHTKELQACFGSEQCPAVLLIRRPYTLLEKAELHKRLVRATAAGRVAEVRELLKEGAQVNFAPNEEDVDTSVSLSHWEDITEDPDHRVAVGPVSVPHSSGSRPSREDSDENGDDEMDVNAEKEEGDRENVERKGNNIEQDGMAHPCGGLSPLLVALATRHETLAADFKELGACPVDMEPRATVDLNDAFMRKDFQDIVKHIARGADVNLRMARGPIGTPGTLDIWSIWPGYEKSFANPLHACAAMHCRGMMLPGAYEIAQVLITLGADLNAGDAEGDTPLAHARFFIAEELHELYRSRGAVLAGPFYRH